MRFLGRSLYKDKRGYFPQEIASFVFIKGRAIHYKSSPRPERRACGLSATIPNAGLNAKNKAISKYFSLYIE